MQNANFSASKTRQISLIVLFWFFGPQAERVNKFTLSLLTGRQNKNSWKRKQDWWWNWRFRGFSWSVKATDWKSEISRSSHFGTYWFQRFFIVEIQRFCWENFFWSKLKSIQSHKRVRNPERTARPGWFLNCEEKGSRLIIIFAPIMQPF